MKINYKIIFYIHIKCMSDNKKNYKKIREMNGVYI